MRIGCLLYLVASALLYPRIAMAQDERENPIPAQETIWERSGVGVIFGGNWARLVDETTTSGPVDYTNRLGFGVGIFGKIGLHRWVFLQPEIQYTPKGSKLEIDRTLSNTIDGHYIELPILARIPLPIGKDRPLYVLAGLVPSALLSLSVEDADDGSVTDRIDIAKRFDLGLLGGIGAQIVLSRQHALIVEARYNRGLFSIYEMDNEENRVFALMLGYQYSLSPTPAPSPEPASVP